MENGHKSAYQVLEPYSTCDVSDALLKLGHPSGGYLPDITMWSPRRQEGNTKIIGPAYTVKFVRNNHVNAPKLEKHYIDTIPSGAVVFISSPAGVRSAVFGGLMGTRAKYSQAAGAVIDGRLRDLQDHRALGFPVFARDVSTPAFYEVAHPSEVNVPVRLQDSELDVIVNPGDLIVADLNGVVCIPQKFIEDVLNMVPNQAKIDDNMAKAIANGITFAEASKQYRGK